MHGLNIQLLNRLQGENGVTEISDTHANLGGLEKYKELIGTKRDLYFVSFVPGEIWEKEKEEKGVAPRTRNEHIKAINYFKADIDIRKGVLEEKGRIITNDELLEYKDKILEGLKKDELLGSYSAVIHSGNGIHIYWIGKSMEIDTKTYAVASSELYQRIRDLFPDEPYLRPDTACGHTGRLLRLPGSYNTKADYGLPPREVEILEYNEVASPLVESFEELGKSLMVEVSKKMEELKRDVYHSKSKVSQKKYNPTFDKINSLDIAKLVCEHTGWRLAPNGINFISNRDGKYTGAFIVPGENIVVHMGTPHFSNYFKVYSPFAFLMIHYCDGDAKKTFEFAKKKYPEVNEEESCITENNSEGEIVLHKYISEHFTDVDKDSEEFNNYYDIAKDIAKYTNFALFPIEEIKTKGEGKTLNVEYVCDLVVYDSKFGGGIQTKQIRIDWETLQNFERIKSRLKIEVPTIKFTKKVPKEEIRDNIQLLLQLGYKLGLGVEKSEILNRIGFSEDNKEFVFNNGILDMQSCEFIPGVYNLANNTAIKISYPWEQVEKLELKDSLRDILSIKDYILPDNNSINSIVVGYLVAGIFRNECKIVKNEFPFLAVQGITGAGKTTLLNFLAGICGYDIGTIGGTNSTNYASDVGMDSLSGWFYFFDEIQKASETLLKNIQAAYNFGESYRGSIKGTSLGITSYRKNCNIICCGEDIPHEEEAFLNRCIILNAKEHFLIAGKVGGDEIGKLKMLGIESTGDYLTQEQTEQLAIDYYRPRFLNILRNKHKINFQRYYHQALQIVKSVANEYGNKAPDNRIINNISTAIAGYLLLQQDGTDFDEIGNIIRDYFENYLELKKDAYISGEIVKYITGNIGEFCGWNDKITYGEKARYPMIYLKYTRNEKGLALQLPTIATYMKDKLNSNLGKNHIKSQLEGALGIQKGAKSKKLNVAKGILKMEATFVVYNNVTKNEFLKEIWDAALDSLGSQMDEMDKIKEEKLYSRYNMPEKTISNLLEEMCITYEKADFFDKESYSKEREE